MRSLVIVLFCLGCHPPISSTHQRHENHVTIVDHGIPVVTSRQWVATLVPNAAGTDWNYIVAAYPGGSVPLQWVVLKNLTTSPTQVTFDVDRDTYPSTGFTWLDQFNSGRTQLRAANGRIFFPSFRNWTTYYEPTTETIHQIGPVVETPPINPNASTAYMAASFDVGGKLYFATQESQYRPSMILVTDTETLEQTILGYVGDGALSYTTYGYYIAPDTGTAAKYVYVAYGQNPWQIWALNITPGPSYGTATKLYEVGSTGNIAFAEVPGKGWRAAIHTNLGSPSDQLIFKWMIDGALYDYEVGVDPPNPRNVTPYSNPLVSAPYLDTSKGVGVVGWRNGSSGPFAYVNYDVDYYTPVQIESLVPANSDAGIVGNAKNYSGFFKNTESDGTTWFGAYPTISRGPRLNVEGDIYAAGYPNGVLIRYDPDAAWQTNVNPTLVGYYGPTGTQYAGIKYSDAMAWAPLAGTQGQLYVAGSRERNGVGSGIGAWKKASNSFIGTYSEPGMDTVVPSGLVVLGDIGRVVMATQLIAPPGTAPLYVFDYDLNRIATLSPIADLADLGPIYDTQTSGVITGILQGSASKLRLWQYNVQTQTLVADLELPITGTIGTKCRLPGTHKVYLMMSNQLVRVDVTTLEALVVADLSAAAPVTDLGFASDGSTLFIAGGTNSGVSGAQLFSTTIADVLVASELGGAGTLYAATLAVDGSSVLSAGMLAGRGSIRPLVVETVGEASAETGGRTASLQNDEGSQVVFGQPLYASGDGRIRLACADDATSATVIGLVSTASIGAISFGDIACDGRLTGTTQQWDAVCGTTGGLVWNTTYYLHPTIPGRLTSTRPTSGFLVPVIQAMSPTIAKLVIAHPVEL